MIASGLSLVAFSTSLARFFSHFCHSDQPFLGWNLKVLLCMDLVDLGVLGKHALSSFQQDWPCAILSSVQEIVVLGSRPLGLISVTNIVFPNFPVRISIGSEMLSVNRENQVVDKLAIFEKLLALWKLMAWIEKILCAKVVCRIAIVGKFPAFWFVFVVFPTSGWPRS